MGTTSSCAMSTKNLDVDCAEQIEWMKKYLWPDVESNKINFDHALCDFVSAKVLLDRCYNFMSEREEFTENITRNLWPHKDPSTIDLADEIKSWQTCYVNLKRVNLSKSVLEYDTDLPHQQINMKRLSDKQRKGKSAYQKVKNRKEVMKMNCYDNSFQCPFCDKRYKAKRSLNFHVRGKHEGITKFKCKYCSRKFLHMI